MSATELYDHLIELAKTGGLISYADAGRFLDLTMENPDHRNRISHVLGEISEREVKQGRPMLSALVVYGETGMPGPGFFVLAKTLDCYRGHTSDDQLMYFAGELKRVYAYWQAQVKE